MSQVATRPPTLPAEQENADRTVGTLIYGMYLAAPVTFGLSGLAGSIVALRRRERAGPVAGSHFRFQLWTFWSAVFALTAGALWAVLGGAQTTGTGDGDGAWLALAGLGLCWTAGVGYLAATVYGLTRLLSRSPIGRFLSR